MDPVVLLGVGMHPWGKFPEESFVDLGVSAILDALGDAGIGWKDVQAMHAACYVNGGALGVLAGNQFAYALGERGIRLTNSFNACASGGMAVRQAFLDVASGSCDIAVAVGAEKSPVGFLPAVLPAVPITFDEERLRWEVLGATNPAYWALECRRRMVRFGTTEEDLAKVKVIFSRNGSMNPRARYKKVYTIDEVLASPIVSDPLRLLQICATSDGAAAVVLCKASVAHRYTSQPVHVRSVSVAGSQYGDPTIRIPFLSSPANGQGVPNSEIFCSAEMAYEQAGIGPGEIDLFELPDNSTWHVLAYLESLQICKEGESEVLVREGAIELEGETPLCPSGGFASFGEAVAAQGLAQICELAWQLRDEAGDRQVKGARVGLAQTFGAMGNGSTVILST